MSWNLVFRINKTPPVDEEVSESEEADRGEDLEDGPCTPESDPEEEEYFEEDFEENNDWR